MGTKKLYRRVSMGQTLTEKIIARASGLQSVSPGEIVGVSVDRLMINDALAPTVFKNFESLGVENVVNPERTLICLDHKVPPENVGVADAYCRIRTFCKKYGMVGFRLLDTFDQRKKVLIFNYHAIKNDLSLEFSDYNDMNEYNYFICKDRKNHNIVCFHDDCIAKGKIISIMKKKFISKLKTEEDIENKDDLFSDFISKYTFEIIESVETTYVKTIRNEYSLNTQLLDENRFDTETDNSNLKI